MIPAGTMTPLFIDMPSVKAEVLGISEHGQYILFHNYWTFDQQGNWIEIRRTYYRDRYFIEGLRRETGGA